MTTKEVCNSAIEIVISSDIESEKIIKQRLFKRGIKGAGISYGGDFIKGIPTIIERVIIAAKKEGIIDDQIGEAAIIGATKEAISHIVDKATGFNIGGKIAVARCKNHIAVVVYFSVGMLNLDEIVLGLGHRMI